MNRKWRIWVEKRVNELEVITVPIYGQIINAIYAYNSVVNLENDIFMNSKVQKPTECLNFREGIFF